MEASAVMRVLPSSTDGPGVMGRLACVKITPVASGSIRGERRRELEAKACRLGIRGKGAVEELRE
jgi:hypothetical protein